MEGDEGAVHGKTMMLAATVSMLGVASARVAGNATLVTNITVCVRQQVSAQGGDADLFLTGGSLLPAGD